MTEEIPSSAATVKPHAASVQVWEVDSPVVIDTPFKVRVGVECSEGCDLTGQSVSIYDDLGEQVSTGTLAAVPWSTTQTQYGAELELQAPVIEDRYGWDVVFEPEMEIPHEESVGTFSVGVSRQPEHRVTVQVVDKDTQVPLKNAHVAIRASLYKGSTYLKDTNDAGIANLTVPTDEYHVSVAHRDYKSFVVTFEVAGNVTTKAELIAGSDMEVIWGPF